MIAVVSFQWVFRDSVNLFPTSSDPSATRTLTFFVLLICGSSPLQLGIYNAALLSMSMMLYLGFADDVLDIKWSVKIFFSFVAAIPLLLAYTGTTTIIIPKLLHGFLPASLELGFLYQFYMACMAVFCTNSINIFAGVNGLESGQSVVIAFSILVHNFLQLSFGPTHEIQQHILSIFLVFPFAATSMGLMYFNWYPSQVFVGDSFTYFAGITFAVAGVLGHFSKTLMIMFIPQLINFAYSLPQLFHKITGIDCPRHRLPRLNHKTGFLEPSRNAQGHMNMTLINLFLKIFGPMNERNLCLSLLVFQVISTAIALSIRYQFEHVYY